VITILTVGYGDIVPVTDNEKLFVIVMSLITSGVFGYTINSIGSIFKDLEESKAKTKN
jgi:voltage-gated potassium channel Kch